MKKVNIQSDKIVVLGNLAFMLEDVRGIRGGHDDDEVFVITEYGEYLAIGINFNNAIFTWATGGN